MYISQLIDIQGGFLPIDIICRMFNLTTMQYNIIISALPKQWKNLIRSGCLTLGVNKFKCEIFATSKGCSAIYYKSVKASTEAFRLAFGKWKEIFPDYGDFCEYFNMIYVITTNTKLRSFQFRMLHKAIILNDRLYRWKIKSTNLCSFCNTKKETQIHFFFECDTTKKIWEEVRAFCNTISDDKFQLSLCNVITNTVNSKSNHLFNFITLVVKHYLYVQRCLSKKPNINKIIAKVKKFQKYELICERK